MEIYYYRKYLIVQESYHAEESRERGTRTRDLNPEDKDERMLDDLFDGKKNNEDNDNHDDVIEDQNRDESMDDDNDDDDEMDDIDDEDNMVEDPNVEEDEENYENKNNNMKLRQDEQQDLSSEPKQGRNFVRCLRSNEIHFKATLVLKYIFFLEYIFGKSSFP